MRSSQTPDGENSSFSAETHRSVTDRAVLRAPRDGFRTTNLPLPLSDLIGRDEQIEELRGLVDRSRLITLTGFGGCGKTRLAIQLAHAVRNQFLDGVWFIDLSSLADPESVVLAVESILNVQDQARTSKLERLQRHLHDQHVLLIIDNCEHVIDAVARSVGVLLTSCHRLQVIATSREPLGVAGETVWPVPALTLPGNVPGSFEELMQSSSAVRLFVDRARAIQPGYSVDRENLDTVVEICRQLDGLPLAIELAAARVKVLSLAEIAERMSDRFRLLISGQRGSQPRQQTLLGAIEWSFDLLSAEERLLFVRLAVFRGGWSLPDAESIASGSDLDRSAVLDLLARLVDRSLVATELAEDGSIRYTFLESIRQFAFERLRESGELADIAERHARSRLGSAERAESKLSGPAYGVWLTRLETDYPNLRAALQWAVESDDWALLLRLTAALAQFWWLRGRSSEGRAWLELALKRGGAVERTDDESRSALGRIQLALAVILRRQGDYQEAMRALVGAADIFAELGDVAGHAVVTLQRGVTANVMGDHKTARLCLIESLREYRALDQSYGITLSLLQLALLAFWQGDDLTASQRVAETLEAFADPTDRNRESALWLSGMISLGKGDLATARQLLDESLALIVNAGDSAILHFVIDGLAAVAAARGRFQRALVLGGAAEMLRERGGFQSPVGWARRMHPVLQRARAALSARQADAAWSEGRAMTLEQVLTFAEQPSPVETRQASRSFDPLGSLTRRERDVLHYVLRGWTNRQVADELSIGERTVETHVANLLGKLGAVSRTQLIARMAEDGLLDATPV